MIAMALAVAILAGLSVAPTQGKAPAQFTVGSLGNVDNLLGRDSELSKVNFRVQPVAQASALRAVDILMLEDASLSSYSQAELDLISQAVAASLPVVVPGSGERLRQFCRPSGTALPDDLEAVRLYAIQRRPGGGASDFYLLQDAIAPEPQEVLMTAPISQGTLPSIDAPLLQRAPAQQSPTMLDAVVSWMGSRGAEGVGQPAAAGAWDAAFDTRWQYTALANLFICTWDFVVSKLADIRAGRDFYVIDVRPHTQIVSYSHSYSSQVGWYIENRTSTLDLNNYDSYGYRQTTLVEYDPTGTVSGSTVSWSIGASVASDAVGGSAEYGRSYNMSDVTMHDQSSLYNAVSKWYETYGGPNYEWYPASMDEPCANSHSSHYSEMASIVSIASDPELENPPLTGVAAHVTVQNKIARDHGFHLDWFQVKWTHSYYTPTMSGTIDVYYNRPPVITEYNPSNDVVSVAAGLTVNFSVTAEDLDGTIPAFEWYLDGALQASTHLWSYSPGQFDGGSHLVRVIATDGDLWDDQIWTVNVSGGVAAPEVPLPVSLMMSQNYPNPFNPNTRIDFGIPRAGMVRLDVYDATGAHVRSLVDAHFEAGRGSVEWNGVDDSGRPVASGTYFCKIVAAGEVVVRKVVLAK